MQVIALRAAHSGSVLHRHQHALPAHTLPAGHAPSDAQRASAVRATHTRLRGDSDGAQSWFEGQSRSLRHCSRQRAAEQTRGASQSSLKEHCSSCPTRLVHAASANIATRPQARRFIPTIMGGIVRWRRRRYSSLIAYWRSSRMRSAGGTARLVFGRGADDGEGHGEVVGEHEARAVGGEVDAGHPALEVERGVDWTTLVTSEVSTSRLGPEMAA
jgi:hypothetical protein